MTSHRHASTLLFVLGSLFFLSGCSVAFAFGDEISGSGTVETRTFDLDDFTGVEIGSQFEGVVVVDDGEAFDVEVIADDNFFEHMDIDVRGENLRVQAKQGTDFGDVTELSVSVTLPALRHLDVSGASDVSVEYHSNTERKVSIDASGASNLDVRRLDAAELVLDLSGASDLSIDGRTSSIEVDLSGASDLDLSGLETATANVDLSGASSMEFGEVDSVTGDLSGASSLTLPDGASVYVEASGGSSVHRD